MDGCGTKYSLEDSVMLNDSNSGQTPAGCMVVWYGAHRRCACCLNAVEEGLMIYL